MSMGIPERDWREFKRVHAELLERFCARVLDEVAATAKAADGTAHERYLRVYTLLEKRDRELGEAFNDFRRSTAEMQLMVLRTMGLLSDRDLDGFSEQTQARVRGFDALAEGPSNEAEDGA